MKDLFSSSWPWYVAGPLIGLMVPGLLLFDNHKFGISSTLRDFCAFVGSKKLDYFKYDLKDQVWRNMLVLGVLIGGFIAMMLTPGALRMHISPATIVDLEQLGIHDFSGFVPREIFSWSNLFSIHGFFFIILGGFLIGFGTRWADGCTAGHAITGLSLMSPASLIAVIGFFIGGLIVTHLLYPLLLNS